MSLGFIVKSIKMESVCAAVAYAELNITVLAQTTEPGVIILLSIGATYDPLLQYFWTWKCSFCSFLWPNQPTNYIWHLTSFKFIPNIHAVAAAGYTWVEPRLLHQWRGILFWPWTQREFAPDLRGPCHGPAGNLDGCICNTLNLRLWTW